MEERAWFEQVYRQNVDLLFRVGRRLLDSDENPDTLYDMVQEIFLLLWDRRETLKTHPNIGGWLMAALCVGIVGALLGLFSAFMPPIVSYFVPWGYFEPLSAYEVAVWDQATHTVIYGTRTYNWALLLATIALGLLLFALAWRAGRTGRDCGAARAFHDHPQFCRADFSRPARRHCRHAGRGKGIFAALALRAYADGHERE